MRPTLEYHINIIVNGLYSNIVYCTYGVLYQNIVFKYYTVSFCKNKVAFIDAFFKKKNLRFIQSQFSQLRIILSLLYILFMNV